MELKKFLEAFGVVFVVFEEFFGNLFVVFGHGFDGFGGFRVIKSLYFERGIIFHKKLLVFSLLLDLLKTRGWEKLLVVLLGLDRNSIVLFESQLFRTQNNIPL